MNYNIRQIRAPTWRGRNLATNSKKHNIKGKNKFFFKKRKRERVAKRGPEKQIQSESALKVIERRQCREKSRGLRGIIRGQFPPPPPPGGNMAVRSLFNLSELHLQNGDSSPVAAPLLHGFVFRGFSYLRSTTVQKY